MIELNTHLPLDEAVVTNYDKRNTLFCGLATYEYRGKGSLIWTSDRTWKIYGDQYDVKRFVFLPDMPRLRLQVYYEGDHLGYVEPMVKVKTVDNDVFSKHLWIATSVRSQFAYEGDTVIESAVKLLLSGKA